MGIIWFSEMFRLDLIKIKKEKNIVIIWLVEKIYNRFDKKSKVFV